MTERLVVVGASLAGLRAVQAARKAGHTGPLTLVGGEEHLPYDRPPLSKAYLEAEGPDGGEPEDPTYRTEDELRGELDLDLRLGTWATGLDAGRKVVKLGDEELAYGALVIATGAAARNLPGVEGIAGVHTLRTRDDADAIRAALVAGARTVVVGAGFIGSEVASSARKHGVSVTVLEALPVPLVRSVGEQIGRACADLHRGHGTDLRCGVMVTGLESSDGRVTGVALDDGSVVPADLVVVGTGVKPCTDWLVDSGVKLHERDGGIICDATLSTGLPGVYAAGDLVHFPNPLFDDLSMRLEHWTNASEQGMLAARNALAPDEAKPSATVPYFWSDWYGSRIQFVGVPQAEEIRVVSEELGEEKFLALYRRGDRITGCISIDRPAQIMKYRRLIMQSKPWSAALELAGV
ncbi:FAD-dependent oxidoreductase [Pseudonocardia eucalypti]|uniref:FAD-dependent oxidoreductase n=1 Tax=Pseudonocardia eucalypti TaxID=648755 RepID=A0ABP9QA75_9PSEU|nr:NADPH-dependent 2,4-dienoyl-CoA reductase/sulfur reductase-like enzyme [Pseudonocardia eucalypti]